MIRSITDSGSMCKDKKSCRVLITRNGGVGGCILSGSLYLMHGVEQLGELIETLPVLAGVLLTLHNGFPQLLNV